MLRLVPCPTVQAIWLLVRQAIPFLAEGPVVPLYNVSLADIQWLSATDAFVACMHGADWPMPIIGFRLRMVAVNTNVQQDEPLPLPNCNGFITLDRAFVRQARLTYPILTRRHD
jgi:hypothetical protein